MFSIKEEQRKEVIAKLENMEELSSILQSSTPDELGLDYTLWNSKVVAEYIYKQYGIVYHERSINNDKIRFYLTESNKASVSKRYKENREVAD